MSTDTALEEKKLIYLKGCHKENEETFFSLLQEVGPVAMDLKTGKADLDQN